MLTKNLLRARKQAKLIKPQFIEGEAYDSCCEQLFRDAQSHLDRTQEDYYSQFINSENIDAKIFDGLVKIIKDRTIIEPACEEHTPLRWDYILEAQAKRHQSKGFDQFAKELEAESSEMTQQKLYSDIEPRRKVSATKLSSARELLDRYNTGLVQGLLLKADQLKFSTSDTETHKIRTLLRQIKFSRLLFDIEKVNDKELSITLSGPLSIFGSTSAYALNFAIIFPYLIQFTHWKIVAEVEWKNQKLKLKLDENSKLRSHYKDQKAFIPKEFSRFKESFNQLDSSWEADFNYQPFSIGKQTFVPDFVLKNSAKKNVYLEIFHPWHKYQLKARSKLKQPKETPLILSCDKNISKNIQLADSSNIYLHHFRLFPTPKSILKLINTEVIT